MPGPMNPMGANAMGDEFGKPIVVQAVVILIGASDWQAWWLVRESMWHAVATANAAVLARSISRL
jgi:hypothetical protein